MNEKYKITLNHNQLRILANALELYNRIGIAQFEHIIDAIEHLFPKINENTLNDETKKITRKHLDNLKKKLFDLNPNASYGISHNKVSNHAKIAYDMKKTIQKIIAITENHSKMSVWHDGNILHLGNEPHIKIENI